MKYNIFAHTDVGLTHKINQDSGCVFVAENSRNVIVFAVLCDGLGGLQKERLQVN